MCTHINIEIEIKKIHGKILKGGREKVARNPIRNRKEYLIKFELFLNLFSLSFIIF